MPHAENCVTLAGLFVFLTQAACAEQDVADRFVAPKNASVQTEQVVAMPPVAASPLEVLAGDMHCHVSPPDDPSDVARDLPETLKLAREAHLDFVVLTPHVPARFFADPGERERVATGEAELRKSIARLASTDVLLVPGFEYTDHRYGHVGVSFADLDAVLAEVSIDQARTHPEAFFDAWVRRGGLLVINHPLVTPIDSIFAIARADLSWRPMTTRGPFPPEIDAIDRRAQGYEVYNVSATDLRDRLLLRQPDLTLESTFAALDTRIPATHRRMTPLGGSDSHGPYVRATTFVLADARTPGAIRAAIAAGRTCVRDRAACSLEIRADRGTWSPVGSTLPDGGALEVRAKGDDIQIIVDGAVVAAPASDEIARLSVPRDRCSVIRARVGTGYSAPIYVHCGISD